MKDISKELKEEAIKLGLCEKWQSEWNNPDKDELVQKYVKGIDFCIYNDFPSIEYMKDNFQSVMDKHGVFVDNVVKLINRDTVVLNGECEGDVTYDGISIGRIYCRHDSSIKLIVKDDSKVFISIYDNARVDIECQDNAKVYVYKYGGLVKSLGNVIIRDKNLE